jgi:hypothetical protein
MDSSSSPQSQRAGNRLGSPIALVISLGISLTESAKGV